MFGRRASAQGPDAPRIILSHPDFEDNSPAGAPTNLMDWEGRFGRRSPLSRKIITFNLVALGVLLTGVLYLNQFQGGIVEYRSQSLITEANLLGHLLADDLADDNELLAEVRLQALGETVSGRIILYNTDIEPIGVVNAPGAVALPDLNAEANQQSAFIAIVGEGWDRLSRIFNSRNANRDGALSVQTAERLVRQVLETGEVQKLASNTPEGEKIATVVVPVSQTGSSRIIGALLMSTLPGEIDLFFRVERERILQVFALAIITSIALSLVLANTIVRPLRALSEAAHDGGTRNARQVNPERINIPDMSGRPDEIGYLSSAMRLMTAALFDRIEANESFAADVAHEIKNPLTSLRSAVETIPYAKTPEQQLQLQEVIKQDVNRLDRLVTDISNASRLDSELVRDQMEPFDLHMLLNNLISFNESQAEKAGATLKAAFHDAPLTIVGLEGRLAQVFVNLITNALSFASPGDQVTVRTAVSQRGRVRVFVEDQGPGIPDDNLADVFERFYSERPDKEAFGNHSGLGLAISRQIVLAHGGEIWAENIRPEGAGRETPPQGARFTVELPV